MKKFSFLIVFLLITIITLTGCGLGNEVEEFNIYFDNATSELEWPEIDFGSPQMAIVVYGTITANVEVSRIFLKCEVYNKDNILICTPVDTFNIKKNETVNFKLSAFPLRGREIIAPWTVKNFDYLILNSNGSNSDTNLSDTTPVVPEAEWIVPVNNYTVGMDYSKGSWDHIYNNILREWFIHKGIDFLTDEGANVFAACDGVIESIAVSVEEGAKITINHGDGLKTIYYSLSEDILATVGQAVKSGDIIGFASTAAYNEHMDGPHVHFEMTQDGLHIDPRTYVTI